MHLISAYNPFGRILLSITILISFALLGACEGDGSPGESKAQLSSATMAEQTCRIDVTALRKLRDDVSKSRSAGTTDGSSRAQETLQRWMEACSGSASEFDRIAVGGLLNRLGESWASQGEYDKAGHAFEQALLLLRAFPPSEELLISLRGKSDCLWKLEQRDEAAALSREQLDVARKMYDERIPTARYLIDALEFTARSASMAGSQAEAAQLTIEAQELRKSIEKAPPDNSVPVPTVQ